MTTVILLLLLLLVVVVEVMEMKIHRRGVQWKQDVVVYIRFQAVLLYITTPIHCTPLRLHPPLMNTQA